MATRRDAREWAVQMLFELDMNRNDPNAVFQHFWSDKKPDDKSRSFAEGIVLGVTKNQEKVDEVLKKYAQHWDIKRMSVVDRNVMRMSIYEMLFCKDVPPVVSINEAVDISKYFNNTESGKFVNGILDRIRKEMIDEEKSGI